MDSLGWLMWHYSARLTLLTLLALIGCVGPDAVFFVLAEAHTPKGDRTKERGRIDGGGVDRGHPRHKEAAGTPSSRRFEGVVAETSGPEFRIAAE